MELKNIYNELEKELEVGENLLKDMSNQTELTWEHHAWGGNIETLISILDPNGVIYDHSTPVGMFYQGWNLATFNWTGIDKEDQIKRNKNGFAQAVGSLKSIVKFRPKLRNEHNIQNKQISEKDIFLIHGHDNLAKQSIARYLEKVGLNVCILHETENAGMTIIEKFEKHSNVGYAIALLTKDDIVKTGIDSNQDEYRARQNVVFELGYFIGKLGRNKVCALKEKGVEIPSNMSGVLYIDLDKDEAWKFKLLKELKATGLSINYENIL